MKIMLLALIVLLINPNPAHITAVDTQSSLHIIVRDVLGNGLAGLDISVRSADDATLLAQAATDSYGQVLFAGLPVSPVRIRVSGQLSSGSVLSQHGSDVQGAWFALGVGGNELAFVVLADGSVDLNPEGLLEADFSLADQQSSKPIGTLTVQTGDLRREDCGSVDLWSCGAEPGAPRIGEQGQENLRAWAPGRSDGTITSGLRTQAGQRATIAIVLSIVIIVLAMVVRGRQA